MIEKDIMNFKKAYSLILKMRNKKNPVVGLELLPSGKINFYGRRYAIFRKERKVNVYYINTTAVIIIGISILQVLISILLIIMVLLP